MDAPSAYLLTSRIWMDSRASFQLWLSGLNLMASVTSFPLELTAASGGIWGPQL